MSSHEQEPTEDSGLEADYTKHLDDLTQAREQFAATLDPSLESDSFSAEIESPEMINDPETGIDYAVYLLNRGQLGPPLVVNLAWSVGAESGVGRADLNEIAAHLPDRPIVTIDMEATGKTGIPDSAIRKAATLKSLAQSHLRVIDSLGIDEFDVSGYSLGGVMAAGIAAEAGKRVGNVITMAAPGFEDIGLVELGHGFAIKENAFGKAYRADAAENRPTVLAQEVSAQAATSGTITARNARTLLKFASLMTQEATADAVARLNPATKWTDVVGSRDAVTDWTGHLAAVRARNAKYPQSSTEHVLGTETHGMGMHRPAMGEVVAATLAKSEHDHQRMQAAAEQAERAKEARAGIDRIAE